MSDDSTSERNEELTIFRQYTRDIPPIDFQIPHSIREKDLILSFASERYDKDGKGNGLFHPTWKVDHSSVEWVKKLKDHPKDLPEVRVIISIGGAGSEFPFDPFRILDWIGNAVESIKQIIDIYGRNIIDGIDIHYDVINSSEDDFSFCIGEVINQLKNDKHLRIKVVSIAPTKLVESYYLKLYKNNKGIIDLVDYQFYNQEFSSKEEVVDLYKQLVIDYDPAKIIAGECIPIHHKLEEGIKYLKKLKLIYGIFVWTFWTIPPEDPTLSL